MNTSEIPAQYILNTSNKHYKIHCNTLQTEINQQQNTSIINQLHCSEADDPKSKLQIPSLYTPHISEPSNGHYSSSPCITKDSKQHITMFH